MPQQETPSPRDLPQKTVTWHLSIHPLSSRPGPKDRQVDPTCIVMLTDLDNEVILATEIFHHPPEANQLRSFLFRAMLQPEKSVGASPHRPQMIQCDNADLIQALAPILADVGVQTSYTAPSEEIDTMLSEIETLLESEFSEIPGLLSIEGVTPELVGDLFVAAANFYRAAPWQALADDQPLGINLSPWNRQCFVLLMGNAGLEFGLVLFWEWEDILSVYQFDSDPLAHLPESGWRSLSFESADMLPTADLEAQKRFGWQVASRQAYPFPVIYTLDTVERPSREELIVYIALLDAIPRFVDEILQADEQGDYLPSEGAFTIQTRDGPLSVSISYPTGVLSEDLALQGWENWLVSEGFDETLHDEMLEADDMEHMSFIDPGDAKSRSFGLLDSSGAIHESDSPIEKAKRLMYRAWDERDPDKRIQLAHQALEIAPNCTEAYLLLAEEGAETLEDACNYYREGVLAGERALGKDFFKENEGDFWGLAEARPYMSALQGLADCLVMMGYDEEALKHYGELLRLNPADNQGIRYSTLALLISMQRQQEAEALLEEYEDDASAAWLYSRALLAFRERGDSPESTTALQQALQCNPHVPAFLTGRKPMPDEPPLHMGFGDESEAIHYVADHLHNWWRTRGAIDWLKRQSD